MQVKANRVILVGTGGTIAGSAASAQDNVGYQAGALAVGDVLQSLPGNFQALTGCHIEPVDLARVDSKDMGPAVWRTLLRSLQGWMTDVTVRAVVITHGTDTLEETAWLLSALMPHSKPVVLTCAMRPASAQAPDGPQNLLDALTVALDPGTRGVCVVAAGWVHAAERVLKVHPYRLDPFSSGDEGALGCVEEGRVRWFGYSMPNMPLALEFNGVDAMNFISNTDQPWPWVELVFSHAGASPFALEALLVPRLGASPLRGLVVAGTGNGTVNVALEPALARAREAGVQVWRCSRCVWGQVVPSAAELAAPAPMESAAKVVALSPFKARLALVLHLMSRPA